MILFNNLWKVMKEKNISQYKLINEYNISPSQLTRLKRNESVSTNTIDKFCEILDCDLSDIMEYKKNNSRKI
ncbi:helix-turn-helix domain-containing protein [Thomasclavelia cocleata]|uniref:helix-turn-helix domain-containing protein n=1 Tax=Thomasclavelia cocleata TaxID=69824 RepID=UPI00255822AE|nr:helix-turn-helix transcriptional regulator [Thomasclavelia cocleata]